MIDKYRNISIEEKANVWSHILGFGLFTILSIVLLLRSFGLNQAHIFVGFLIFSLMTLFSYFSSIRYHLAFEKRDKYNWRIVDHICIYLLIGGSYSAFILRFMYTDTGLLFLGLHWFIIVLGILKKVWFTGRFELLSIGSYLFLGWMVMFIYDDIIVDMSPISYRFLWIGAIYYTLGIVFYKWESLRFHHLIWHIFVIGGTLSHFISVINSM